MPDTTAHEVRGGRRSWTSYARILRSIHDGVDTTAALAVLHGLRKETMREILRRMLALDLVHIGGSVRAESNGIVMPRWALGKGSSLFATNTPLQPTTELIAMAAMFRALTACPMTSRGLAAEVGLTPQRVAEFMKVCLKELRMVYVANYRRGRVVKGRMTIGGSPSPMYAFGFDTPSVARPEPLSSKQVDARAYARVKAKRQRLAAMEALYQRSSIFRLAA